MKNDLLNIKNFILIGCILLCSVALQAQLQCVIAGAGTSGINGTYVWDGTATNNNGNPVFSHTENNYYLHESDSYPYTDQWIINTNDTWTDEYSGIRYYTTTTSSSTTEPPTSGWTQFGETYYIGDSCYDYGNPDCDTDGCYCYTASGVSYAAEAPVPSSFVCGPAPIPSISVQQGCWSSVASGTFYSIGIQTDGTLWSWGSASSGKLGNGTTSGDVLYPTQISTDTDWASVVTGRTHTMALKTDGTLWTWGRGGGGRLGHGNTSSLSVPTQVGTDTDWMTMAAGENDHSMALKTDGTLWTWGSGGSAKLGNGTTSGNVLVPTQIGTDTDWTSVACAYHISMALKTDGTLWTWGANHSGRLGNGATTGNVMVPTQIGTDTDWGVISAGDVHAMALKTDGTLWTWGNAGSGRLGNGTTSGNVLVPTQIGTDTWIKIIAGQGHSIGQKTDGTLWTWGGDSYGRLGNGSSSNTSVPIQVGNDGDWTSISGRSNHMVVVKSDGSFWGWGAANDGGLGNGQDDGDVISPIKPSQAYVSKKGIVNTIVSDRLANDGDWTYYYNNSEGGLLFSINWAPDGSLSAANDAALRNSTVTIDVMSNYNSITDGTDGAFLMGRYWNVDTDGNVLDEPVSIRYYYDLSEVSDIETAAASYGASNGSSITDLKWFKQNSDFDPSSINNADFKPDVFLIPSSTGMESCSNNYIQFDGITSFSGGGAGVGVGDAFTSVLPVELMDFTGRLINNDYVQLDWKTASEVNNEGFDIERSQDGQNWERIGYMEGYGNTTEMQVYGFDDYEPYLGVSYYRLKQMDFDGAYEYSKVITINKKQSNSLSIYPNPSKGNHIFLNLEETISGTLSIYNAKGQLVLTQQLENAENGQKIDLPNITTGIYIIELSTESEQLVSRMIID